MTSNTFSNEYLVTGILFDLFNFDENSRQIQNQIGENICN